MSMSPCRAEAADGGCQLTVTLHTEAVADAAAAQLFPANALRNAALLNARTQLVMVLDGDMLVAPALSAQLANPAGYAADMQCSHLGRWSAGVPPALQSVVW
jgi:Glycosyl-transferase for dystroglycan